MLIEWWRQSIGTPMACQHSPTGNLPKSHGSDTDPRGRLSSSQAISMDMPKAPPILLALGCGNRLARCDGVEYGREGLFARTSPPQSEQWLSVDLSNNAALDMIIRLH